MIMVQHEVLSVAMKVLSAYPEPAMQPVLSSSRADKNVERVSHLLTIFNTASRLRYVGVGKLNE
jgi:hypothetical protein